MADNSEKQSWLESGRYYALRIVLVVAACILLAAALISMYSNTQESTRAQQLAIEMVQSETVAETLFLGSYDSSDVPTKKQRDAITDYLHSAAVAVDVGYFDACDNARGYASGPELVNSVWSRGVKAKLEEHGPYNCIICLDDESLRFVEETYDELFDGTPVVFFGINDVDLAERAYNAGYATGIIETYDTPRFLDIVRGIRPEATKVLAITDTTDTGIGIQQQFTEVVEQYPGLDIEYVNASAITRDELAQSVSNVGDDTIVLYLSAHNDVDGNGYSSDQSARFLYEHCPQPIFSTGFFGVGEGFTGSAYLDYIGSGEEAGKMVLSILNGTNPSAIPVEDYISDGSVYDARKLALFDIPKSSLPMNATFINQSGMNWDAIKPIILPIFLLLLGGICIALFALFGYKRSVLVTQKIMGQGNMLEQHFYINKLTDKPNMQWLTTYASSNESKGVRSIIALSLLGMETIDDSYGPGTADSVIKQLAHRLEGVPALFLVQATNVEFILGINHELHPGDEIFETVDYLLKRPIEIDEQQVNVKACIAVCNREHIMSLEEMVAGVEIAINQAIQIGNTDEIIFYDRDLRRAVEDNIEVSAAVRKAIANEDFYVVYQPQVDLESMQVVGYEALARMKGDEYAPEEFMAIAELNGQLVDIDRIVSKMVVQQLAKWKRRKQRMRTVTINHGLGQLRDKEYIDYMVGLMDRYDLNHNLLCFDLKESLFINNMPSALGFADEVKKAGFSIAVDSFGDGYMSVQRVMALPTDVVKIDDSLTSSFLLDGETGVVGNLVRLVHSAGKTVVIEGIETIEQVEMCQVLGCDVVQGFFFAEPMRPERAVQFKPSEIIIGESSTSENAETKSAAKSSAKSKADEELIGNAVVAVVAETEADSNEAAAEEAADPAAAEEETLVAEGAAAEETSANDEPSETSTNSENAEEEFIGEAASNATSNADSEEEPIVESALADAGEMLLGEVSAIAQVDEEMLGVPASEDEPVSADTTEPEEPAEVTASEETVEVAKVSEAVTEEKPAKTTRKRTTTRTKKAEESAEDAAPKVETPRKRTTSRTKKAATEGKYSAAIKDTADKEDTESE